MSVSTFKVGDTLVHRLIELEAPTSHALTFLPGLTAEMLDSSRDWMRAQNAIAADDHLLLSYHSFVIQTGQHNILVDSCIGNDKERAWRPHWHLKTDDRFLGGLASIGLRPEDIDYVMCTHLHTDHVGWNTRLENGRWVPTFPNARYLFNKVELDYWLQRNAATVVPAIADSVIPILDTKQCDIVSGDHALNDLISLIPTPGHTKGHFAVALGRSKHEAIFTGDLIHTPLQARWPDLSMHMDFDAAQSAATRRRFLDTYCGTDTLCCFAHFPTPSKGFIERSGDGFTCRYDHD